MNQSAKIEGLEKIIQSQEDYIRFLKEELDEMSTVLFLFKNRTGSMIREEQIRFEIEKVKNEMSKY